jgi:subtilase family serine protease
VIAKPDLVVTVLTAPATAGAGLQITVNSTVKNQATTAVTAAASTLAFYLSTDATFDVGDVRLTATRAIPSLAKDAVSAGATTLTIPAGTAAGSYFLIAVADDLGAIDEANEGNNTRTAPIAISRPDLSVTSVTVTPTLTGAGMNVSITQIVRNVALSPANAPGSSSRLTLSGNTTLGDGDDADLGTVTIPALAAATQATVTKSVPIPVGTAPGLYWIFARANDGDVIPEAGGANNAARTALPITIGPDLIVSAATATPVTTAPGLTVSVSNTVKNQGGQAAGPFDVGVYLSTNNTYDDGIDLLLNTRRVATGLAPGAMSVGAIPVVIPANQAAGSYFLIVRADITGSTPGEVAEANEANNVLVVPLTVARADLAVTSVTAPAVAAAGTNVSITHVVKNLAVAAGGAPATFSRLFLSANDATLDGGDVQLGGDLPVGPLAGGAMATVTKSVLIPPGTAPGRYFVIAQANATGTVVEADGPTLANNVKATATPIIVGPDLVVSAATLTPTATAPGMTVNVTNTVKNQGGTGAGAFTVGIYLSPDNVFDAGSDTLLNSRAVLSLAAGAMSGRS